MFPSFASLATVALAATTVFAAPAVLTERANSCTFSGTFGAAAVAKSKTSCSTITLDSLFVPAGTTLDLTKLKKGTHVVFKGTTTFGYKEWSGPLVSISGDSLTIDGTGATLNGDGARWWDTKGSNGGKTKPKFFYAHSMTNSVVKGLVSSPTTQMMRVSKDTDQYADYQKLPRPGLLDQRGHKRSVQWHHDQQQGR